jgi:ATP-dependent Clp protease protease subunit
MNKTSKSKEAEISIMGEIGHDYWGDGLRKSAADFKKELDTLGEIETINLIINSPGGSFFDGLAIYSIIKKPQGYG